MSKSKKIPVGVQENAQLQLAKTHYRYYLRLSHHGNYVPLRHTELIADELQKIIDGEQRHILIEMPPRHGKSMSVTETFPSYYLGKNPDKKVITAAYSDGLARGFGRLNRNKFNEFAANVFDLRMADDNSSVADWSIFNHTGGMVSTGIGGSITGKGADLLLIDDPIKNAKEAQSVTARESVWQEWESTLSTRLHKGASVIVIMTRWHEDDFVGRLLKNSPYNWHRLRLPAVAEEEGDFLGREVGETLSPELGFDMDWAENKKVEVGSKTWASLYQQRPSASEGNIFNRNWWQYYESLPRFFDEQIISWDLTFKDNNDNDYVVGQVWGRKGADYYLVDQVRDKMDFPTTVTAVRNLSNKYPRASAKLIEDKANGPAVIATLKREVNGIIPVNPQGSKVARAQAVTPFIESGNVFLPKHKEFSYDLIEEAAAFPNGKHDDQVDSASQALSRLASRKQAGISSVNIW